MLLVMVGHVGKTITKSVLKENKGYFLLQRLKLLTDADNIVRAIAMCSCAREV